MRVLLCSSYKTSKEYIQGGIVVWTNNVLDYYKTQKDAPEIELVSYDRKDKNKYESEISFLYRVTSGIKDYVKPVNNTIRQLKTRKYDVVHLLSLIHI